VRTTRFCNNLHQVTLKVERLESQINIKCLGAIKPKSTKVTYIGLREENVSFDKEKFEDTRGVNKSRKSKDSHCCLKQFYIFQCILYVCSCLWWSSHGIFVLGISIPIIIYIYCHYFMSNVRHAYHMTMSIFYVYYVLACNECLMSSVIKCN
jgi:hypothetical protein